jgi:hypothetical protein
MEKPPVAILSSMTSQSEMESGTALTVSPRRQLRSKVRQPYMLDRFALPEPEFDRCVGLRGGWVLETPKKLRYGRMRPLNRRLHGGIIRRHEGELVLARGRSTAPAV